MTATVLITRPKEDAERLARELAASVPKIEILIAPVMEICAVEHRLPKGPFDALILTSRHAVSAAQALIGVPTYCVGSATSAVAKDQGHNVREVFETADALVDGMLGQETGRCLHLHGRHTRGQISERLNFAGFETQSRVVYDQTARVWTAKEKEDVFAQKHLILPLYSPRTADLVGKQMIGYEGELRLIGMSQACIAAWSGPNPTETSHLAHPKGALMKSAIATQVARSRLERGDNRV